MGTTGFKAFLDSRIFSGGRVKIAWRKTLSCQKIMQNNSGEEVNSKQCLFISRSGLTFTQWSYLNQCVLHIALHDNCCFMYFFLNSTFFQPTLKNISFEILLTWYVILGNPKSKYCKLKSQWFSIFESKRCYIVGAAWGKYVLYSC